MSDVREVSFKRVTKFVESLVGRDVGMFVLYHLSPARRMSQIGAWPKDGRSEIGTTVWEYAVAFTDGLTGAQTFVLKAFEKSDTDRMDSVGSTAFRASSPHPDDAPPHEQIFSPSDEVTLLLDEMLALAQRGRPAPIIDSKDGAGFDVAMMEAVVRPIVFRVRVKLGKAGERTVEVLARPATT